MSRDIATKSGHNEEINPGASMAVPLTEAPLGIPLRVKAITGGFQAKARLASMGILPGEEVTVLQRSNSGPLLLEVKGTRVALGRGISLKVTVGR